MLFITTADKNDYLFQKYDLLQTKTKNPQIKSDSTCLEHRQLPNEVESSKIIQHTNYLSFSPGPKVGSTAPFPTPLPEPQNTKTNILFTKIKQIYIHPKAM